QGHGAVHFGIEPALVDGVGDGVAVDGRGRGFEVRVVAVEQLVPEAAASLPVGQAAGVGAQQLQHGRAAGVVGGQHVE
nr:hypothetical protein [Tanacetum cinerariifolium]